MNISIQDMPDTGLLRFSKSVSPNEMKSVREEFVENIVHKTIAMIRVIDNLAIIARDVEYLNLPYELQNRLISYCQVILDNSGVDQFRGTGAHKIRIFINDEFDRLTIKSTVQIAKKELNPDLAQWYLNLEHVRCLSRDLVNRIFNQKRQRDRDRIEADAMEHPLVKSWEGLSQKDGVKRISRSRMNKFLNRQGNNLEILLQRTCVQTYPSRITLEPTSACNYRCTMCSHGHYTLRPTDFEVDDGTIEHALPLLEFCENLATQVTGEPTLSLQFGKIANFASSHGVYIDMITNGSLLHKTNADLSKFSIVCISFDGATKEVFEAQRVGSSFANVMKNISMARKLFPLVEFEFNVCVTRLNISQLADIVRIASEFGVDRVLFNLLNPRDYPHLAPLALGASNIDELNNGINAARKAAEGTCVRVFNYITDRALNSKGSEDTKSVSELISHLSKMEKQNTLMSPEDTAEKLISLEFPLFFNHNKMSSEDKDLTLLSNQPDASIMVDRSTVRERYEELLPKVMCAPGKRVKLPYCTAPYKGGIIFSSGEYTPCCFIGIEASFGSISENSFEKIWNCSGLQEFRLSMFEDKLLIPACRNCNARQRYTFTIELIQAAHRLGYGWEEIEFPSNFNPPTAVKKQLDSLRNELFASGADYKLGTILKFGVEGNARFFTSSGFSAPGPNGVWNDGFESVITLKLKEKTVSDLLFEATLFPFLYSDILPEQCIEVSVNTHVIESWYIKQAKMNICSIKIPGYLVDSGNKVQLIFRFPNASSWHDLQLKKAKGTRSVMFVEACLSEVAEKGIKPLKRHRIMTRIAGLLKRPVAPKNWTLWAVDPKNWTMC